MTSMSQWTDSQWAVFGVTIAAGVAAAVLLYVARSSVLGWAPPAPPRRIEHTSAPRPSIVLAQRRTLLPTAPLPPIEPAREVPVIVGQWSDPMAADFTDPGIGALSSILALDNDAELVTEAERAVAAVEWINAYADLAPMMPETAAAAETMRANLEPALRKARLWRIRGEGGPAQRALNDWRIDTPTGEYPMLTTADLHPYVAALLAS